MAVASDLNHDGYSDLLVGAPLEDEHQGAIYIYHGDEFYIIPHYKQVKSCTHNMVFKWILSKGDIQLQTMVRDLAQGQLDSNVGLNQ